MASIEPCPCERIAPPPAPGPIDDPEVVIRLVKLDDHVGEVKGVARLNQTHWSKSDLRDRDRHASIFRACIAAQDITLRAQAYNACKAWANDPVIATAIVRSLREIKDETGYRELCVNAHPVTDQHGACATHGGITRSEPGPVGKNPRTAILTIIDKLCDKFVVKALSEHLTPTVSLPPVAEAEKPD